jgi:hypothetical protein
MSNHRVAPKLPLWPNLRANKVDTDGQLWSVRNVSSGPGEGGQTSVLANGENRGRLNRC